MTRTVAHLYLDSASLTALRVIVGQSWAGITGDLAQETPGLTLSSWAEATAETVTRALTFSSHVSRSNCEGLDEEHLTYTSLQAAQGWKSVARLADSSISIVGRL